MQHQYLSRPHKQTLPSTLLCRSDILQRNFGYGMQTVGREECEQCHRQINDLSHRAIKPMIPIQTKLRLGKPGDRYEQEAESIANQVVTNPAILDIMPTPLHIQQFVSNSGQEVDPTYTPASFYQALSDPGQPLEMPLRRDMEQQFGYDFSEVRVHTSNIAANAAHDIHASAYTVGNSIVFAAGKYSPSTRAGKKLIAHELVHTIQQSKDSSTQLYIQRRPCTESPLPLRPQDYQHTIIQQWYKIFFPQLGFLREYEIPLSRHGGKSRADLASSTTMQMYEILPAGYRHQNDHLRRSKRRQLDDYIRRANIHCPQPLLWRVGETLPTQFIPNQTNPLFTVRSLNGQYKGLLEYSQERNRRKRERRIARALAYLQNEVTENRTSTQQQETARVRPRIVRAIPEFYEVIREVGVPVATIPRGHVLALATPDTMYNELLRARSTESILGLYRNQTRRATTRIQNFNLILGPAAVVGTILNSIFIGTGIATLALVGAELVLPTIGAAGGIALSEAAAAEAAVVAEVLYPTFGRTATTAASTEPLKRVAAILLAYLVAGATSHSEAQEIRQRAFSNSAIFVPIEINEPRRVVSDSVELGSLHIIRGQRYRIVALLVGR